MNGNIERVTEAQVRRELLRMNDQTGRKRAFIGAAVILAAALLAGTLAVRFLFQMAVIRTDGMMSALQSGDVVLCEKLSSPLPHGDVARGALVLLRYNDDGLQRQTVRRVIAMAGDEVSVEPDGHVSVNGEALDEPYAVYRTETDWSEDDVESAPGGALENPFASAEDATVYAFEEEEVAPERVDDMNYPFTVPDGALFVLCDNRKDLMDSRSSRFGLVKRTDALALARAVIWPAHRAAALLRGDGLR